MVSRYRRNVLLPAAILGFIAILAAACGSDSSTTATSPSPTIPTSASETGTTSTENTSPAATAPGAVPAAINVALSAEPSGTVVLTWDAQTKKVSAELHMTGFAPGSKHAMHIHKGSCAEQGEVLVPFPDVVADDGGAVNTTLVSSEPAPNGLEPGTFLNIHLGSNEDLAGSGSLLPTPISCADITPPAPATLEMKPVPPAGNRQGSAELKYDVDKKTLTVTTKVSGLEPDSQHAAHVHVGSCSAQGAVKYPLDAVVASSDGTADTTTVIENVDQPPPPSGWYVNIHLGSPSQITDQGKPTPYFQPILCGDVGY